MVTLKTYTRKELFQYIKHLESDLGLLSAKDSQDLIQAVERGLIPLKDACNLIDNVISLGRDR
ncbi:MAG: hypothetical protein J7647_29685 [Cyanobacteria bacterium SBLK]|nr:hypothetical protein [Cyanobacteria bacterium SBLK]